MIYENMQLVYANHISLICRSPNNIRSPNLKRSAKDSIGSMQPPGRLIQMNGNLWLTVKWSLGQIQYHVTWLLYCYKADLIWMLSHQDWDVKTFSLISVYIWSWTKTLWTVQWTACLSLLPYNETWNSSRSLSFNITSRQTCRFSFSSV